MLVKKLFIGDFDILNDLRKDTAKLMDIHHPLHQGTHWHAPSGISLENGEEEYRIIDNVPSDGRIVDEDELLDVLNDDLVMYKKEDNHLINTYIKTITTTKQSSQGECRFTFHLIFNHDVLEEMMEGYKRSQLEEGFKYLANLAYFEVSRIHPTRGEEFYKSPVVMIEDAGFSPNLSDIAIHLTELWTGDRRFDAIHANQSECVINHPSRYFYFENQAGCSLLSCFNRFDIESVSKMIRATESCLVDSNTVNGSEFSNWIGLRVNEEQTKFTFFDKYRPYGREWVEIPRNNQLLTERIIYHYLDFITSNLLQSNAVKTNPLFSRCVDSLDRKRCIKTNIINNFKREISAYRYPTEYLRQQVMSFDPDINKLFLISSRNLSALHSPLEMLDKAITEFTNAIEEMNNEKVNLALINLIHRYHLLLNQLKGELEIETTGLREIVYQKMAEKRFKQCLVNLKYLYPSLPITIVDKRVVSVLGVSTMFHFEIVKSKLGYYHLYFILDGYQFIYNEDNQLELAPYRDEDEGFSRLLLGKDLSGEVLLDELQIILNNIVSRVKLTEDENTYGLMLNTIRLNEKDEGEFHLDFIRDGESYRFTDSTFELTTTLKEDYK